MADTTEQVLGTIGGAIDGFLGTTGSTQDVPNDNQVLFPQPFDRSANSPGQNPEDTPPENVAFSDGRANSSGFGNVSPLMMAGIGAAVLVGLWVATQ